MKTVILGVTASIAAYKSLELTRLLTKKSLQVIPILTPNANHFITPLSIESLSSNKALCDFFEKNESIIHISTINKANLIAIVPATANFIGKLASGIVDNLLLGTVFASDKPVLIAPAMNKRMWTNPIVKANVQKLKKLGYYFVGPAKGLLASQEEGIGRLEDIELIAEEMFFLLEEKKGLTDKKILITLGRTKEYLDPIRYISNDASGRFGVEIAKLAKRRGAQVNIVAGHTDIPIPSFFSVKHVTSTAQMAEEVLGNIKNAHIIIMNAACSDFMAKSINKDKIKKTEKEISLSLKKTNDILTLLKPKKGKRLVVGFSIDTKERYKYAKKKMHKKGVDIMIANPVCSAGSERVKISILLKGRETEHLPEMSKSEAAAKILDTVVSQI